jgi:perosamine synthetase
MVPRARLPLVVDASAVTADLLPVSQPWMSGRELEYVEAALASTQVSGAGDFVDRMEALVANAAGTRHAVVVASGTAALDLAFDSLGVSAGDEVIVPDFTMFAPVAALARRGATVVPVDADETWNMRLDHVAAAITERTTGVVVVHTYGHPADATGIGELARRHGLWVVEDAAEAMGAKLDGRPAGSFGDLATFSFYANKVVTSGEGGAIVTDDAGEADRLRALRSMCFGEAHDRFVHARAGYSLRLSNVLAAIGCAQLERLDEAVARKRDVAACYSERLAGVPGLLMQPQDPRVRHSYWVFGVLLPPGRDRREIADRLRAEGIDTRPFFHPVHLQPCLAPMPGSFPIATELSERGLYLPSFAGMTEADVARGADALVAILS